MKEPPAQMAAFSPQYMNGTYTNQQLEDSLQWTGTLWNILYACHLRKTDPTVLTPKTVIQLHATENVLMVTAMEDSIIVNRFELEGHVKGDYFVVKRKLFLIPVPLLFYWHNESKAIIGISETGLLVVKYGIEELRWILMAGENGYRGHAEFSAIR
jgi:hypothetical protein